VVLGSDPRVPQTIAAAKKRRNVWLLIGSQANIEGGYYRRDMDMGTASAEQPTYTATWRPNVGDVVKLVRASGDKAYDECVRHCQANCRG
jgi:hypothetical protein